MSTYLLAFIIGEFDYLEGRDSDGVLVRVYTPLEKKDQGQFALDVSYMFSMGLLNTTSFAAIVEEQVSLA